MGPIGTLSPRTYRVLRSLLFPGNRDIFRRLRGDGSTRSMRACASLAVEYGATLFEPPPCGTASTSFTSAVRSGARRGKSWSMRGIRRVSTPRVSASRRGRGSADNFNRPPNDVGSASDKCVDNRARCSPTARAVVVLMQRARHATRDMRANHASLHRLMSARAHRAKKICEVNGFLENTVAEILKNAYS